VLPRASFVAEDRSSGSIAAFLLATTIGPDTAHVAQLAVDPRWVRQGAGRALIRHVSRAAAAEGFRRLSVLLPGESAPAMRLLASEGFLESSQVVFASRTMPVRRQVTTRRVA
jgi:ribosomal protein S18 acetylase RimI-like enzyme